MDLRVSAVLLLIFCIGGYSLKCYDCTSLTGSCSLKETTCADGETCMRSSFGSIIYKGCTPACVNETQQIGGIATMKCCDTDLCNAADGMYKGSFLLLFSPLLFYFLFQ